MDEYLWPSRNVAEFAYCPRLFYLMEVEGYTYPTLIPSKGIWYIGGCIAQAPPRNQMILAMKRTPVVPAWCAV